MVVPLMGGWKVCHKKSGKQGISQTVQRVSFSGAESSIGAKEDFPGVLSKCACKKGKSCPVIPQVFLASGRSVSRAEDSSQTNSVRIPFLVEASAGPFVTRPPGAFDGSDVIEAGFVPSHLRLSTVLLI
jgi:hypothetical protein